MMTDPIADMLTRIRNAYAVRKPEVTLPFSKIKSVLADILVREGYLAKIEKTTDNRNLVLTLKYTHGEAAVHEIKRVSKPGCRCYVGKDEVKEVLNGFGIALISTPRGVLTNKEAKAAKVGGEVLCEVY